MTIHFISVDFQQDFVIAGGACYQDRPCVGFIQEILVPHCRKHGIQIAEIISDYRQPRPGAPFAHCVPGTQGYESQLAVDVTNPRVWVKCMHSPVWVRKNGGVAAKPPGKPYQDPDGFTRWLASVIGPPQDKHTIVLFGLTLDCCVLCTAQELFFRGYRVNVLVEGVDSYSGSPEDKRSLFNIPLPNWGKPVSWQDIKNRLLI